MLNASWHGNRNTPFSSRDEGCLLSRSKLTFDVEELTMLGWAITFLVIALIAGVLGFGGIMGASAGIAKILFFVFIVLFVIGLLMGRRGPVV